MARGSLTRPHVLACGGQLPEDTSVIARGSLVAGVLASSG